MGSARPCQQTRQSESVSPIVMLSETTTQSLAGFDPVRAAIAGRMNVSPKRLLSPGPSAPQLEALLGMAAAAPDHGHLLPWRFVTIPESQRHRLSDAFVSALISRDPSATQEQMESAAEKAHRSQLLILAIACLGNVSDGIPDVERLVSLGAAIQNILVGATALGFGSGLTSGQAMNSPEVRRLFQLRTDETAVCFVNIGTVRERKVSKRVRPQISAFVSTLGQ